MVGQREYMDTTFWNSARPHSVGRSVYGSGRRQYLYRVLTSVQTEMTPNKIPMDRKTEAGQWRPSSFTT